MRRASRVGFIAMGAVLASGFAGAQEVTPGPRPSVDPPREPPILIPGGGGGTALSAPSLTAVSVECPSLSVSVGASLAPRDQVILRLAFSHTDDIAGDVVLAISGGNEHTVRVSPRGRRSTALLQVALSELDATTTIELREFRTSGERVTSRERDAVSVACIVAPPRQAAVLKRPGRVDCPQAAGWSAVATFAGSLDRPSTFCSYTWSRPGEPDVIALRAAAGSAAQLQYDVPAVVPQQSSIRGVEFVEQGLFDFDGVRDQLSARPPLIATDDVPAIFDSPFFTDELLPADYLAERTAERLGITELALQDAYRSGGDEVWLAVVDTAVHPIDAPELDRNDHGRAVGLAAQLVACGSASSDDCPVRVLNVLGLPRLRDGSRDETNGGYLGSRTDLARSLSRLLDSWQSETGGSVPLVINLSFGWHPGLECDPIGCDDPGAEDSTVLRLPDSPLLVSPPDGFVSSEQLASEPVLHQLARARCLGALVFAASGNASGQDRTGPLLPAAYNRIPGASIACGSFAPAASLDGPLVRAVGATTFDGGVSARNRERALPNLLAFGVGFATDDPRSGYLVKSGSSLATAVVSGAAARLWSLLGADASAADVEALLMAAGEPRGGSAELCAEQDCGEPVEVTACTPFEAAGIVTDCVLPRVLGSYGWLQPSGWQSPVPVPSSAATAATLSVPNAPWIFPQPSDVNCGRCAFIDLAGTYGFALREVRLGADAVLPTRLAIDGAYLRLGQRSYDLGQVSTWTGPSSGIDTDFAITLPSATRGATLAVSFRDSSVATVPLVSELEIPQVTGQ